MPICTKRSTKNCKHTKMYKHTNLHKLVLMPNRTRYCTPTLGMPPPVFNEYFASVGSYLSRVTITNAVFCSSIKYPIKLNLRNQVLSRDHRHFSSSFSFFCHCSWDSTKILSMQMKVLEESLGAEVLLSKGFWLDYSNAPRGIYSRFKLEVSVTMMAPLLANKKTIHSIVKWYRVLSLKFVKSIKLK